MSKKGRGPGQPDSENDVINKYGTYEVQCTNGTENEFPQIAQGLAKAERQRLRQEYTAWLRRPRGYSNNADSHHRPE